MTEEQINFAVSHFKNGDVVIFPTETVMGIGCSIKSQTGVERVYQIKGRNPDQPTHVLVSSLDMALKYGDFSPLALKLAARFWPGPLTIVVPSKPNQQDYLKKIANSDGKLGFRVPSLSDLITVISTLGYPILGPSANKKGRAPATSLQTIDKDILSLVDYTIDSQADGQVPSTIIEIDNNDFKVIREGPITKEQLNSVLKEQNEQV
jgi:L-threonylcarbamoyladenylate synthase